MLNFDRIKAPAADGQVLIDPAADLLPGLVSSNARLIAGYRFTIGGLDFQEARRQARKSMCPGCEGPIIVTGHQPEFFHPGVWAKHLLSHRLARALGGQALNLVVDNDAPKGTTLAVPRAEGGQVVVTRVPYATYREGVPFEHIASMSAQSVKEFGRAVSEAGGADHARSLMPEFLDGLASAAGAQDWVDQMVIARRRLDGLFGVELHEHRVSRCRLDPLLTEMLLESRRFAEAYNASLLHYRQVHKVRSNQRPIPDLAVLDGRRELPIWVYRRGDVRRRLMVVERDSGVTLFAEDQPVISLRTEDVADWEQAGRRLLDEAGWRLRPRALTLTLWARLLLADLFVHGIGGAKYDRITDELVRRYFGVEPPAMACVTATLRLGLMDTPVSDEDLMDARLRLRRLRFNTHLLIEAPDAAGLAAERRAAVERSEWLRANRPGDHRERKQVFDAIRRINDAILALEPDLPARQRAEIQRLEETLREKEKADSREYFFGLFSRDRLEEIERRMPWSG